jgi:hypothetical protein
LKFLLKIRMENRPKLLSYEEIKERIKTFNIKEWNHLDILKVNEYVNALDNYFINNLGFVFRTLRITNTDKLPNKVFRIRKYSDQINHNLISEFSYPPASCTTGIQRANLPFHPVFYGAPSAHTALIETLKYSDKKNDNLYYLSEWEFRKDQPIYVTPFIFGEYEKVDVFNLLAKKAIDDFKKKINNITVDESKAIDLVFKVFSELFEYQDSHAISGYLAHTHLYFPSNIRTDLFIYPSIGTGKASMNFAFHPNAVMHKLLLKRIYLLEVENYEIDTQFNKVKFTYHLHDKLGINNEHGYLIWRNLPADDESAFKTLFPE